MVWACFYNYIKKYAVQLRIAGLLIFNFSFRERSSICVLVSVTDVLILMPIVDQYDNKHEKGDKLSLRYNLTIRYGWCCIIHTAQIMCGGAAGGRSRPFVLTVVDWLR